MGYQFIHLACYARAAGARKTGGHSIVSIAAEAERQEGACPHVEAPQPPILLFGCMPSEAAQAATAWAEQARDSRDHALRKDGLCLGASVITWPENRPPAEWAAFRDDSIEWLKNKYQKRLLSVVEHIDEPHPHIHFYTIPLPDERFDVLHPGKAAAAAAKAAGILKKGGQNQAYREAMREFQSDFHKEVSQFHGLTRLGPRVRRRSRAEWKAEQLEAERQARELARIKKSGELVDLQKNNLAEAVRVAEAEGQRLAQERRELQKIIASARQESSARAKQIQSQAAKAFQGGIDSRRRQKEWQRQRPALFHALPAGLTYLQIVRRQLFFQKWRWLEDPTDTLRKTVESSQNSPILQRILNQQSRTQKAERVAEALAREARERLDSLKPLQLLEKARFSGELRAAEKALADARADLKRLAGEEKKLLQSCPSEVMAKYQHHQEEAREKALAALLTQEAQEIEEERRKEAAESKARQERMAMRPAAKKKPGGWSPPSPS